MRSPSLLRITKSSVQYLSSSDQVVLANILNAYEDTCIVAKNTQFQCFPAVQHTSLHEYLNEMSLIFPVFIEYFKHVPEFVSIDMDDKIRLVKNHFGIMINMNEVLMYRVIPSNHIITWTNVFGVDITERLVKRNQIVEQYIFDPVLLKIVLIILVLSSSNSRNLETTDIDQICDDSLSIFAAQNVYVELLWRYILSRSSSERDAVKFLNKLMMCIFYVKNLNAYIYSYINSLTDEVKQIEPMMQSMWPKVDDEENVRDININEGIIL
jgi:hypothetical protein